MFNRHRRSLVAIGLVCGALSGPLFLFPETAFSFPVWQVTDAIAPLPVRPDPGQVQADIDEINAIRKRIGSGIAEHLDGVVDGGQADADRAFREELDRLAREANALVAGIQEPISPPQRGRMRDENPPVDGIVPVTRRRQDPDRANPPGPATDRRARPGQPVQNDRPGISDRPRPQNSDRQQTVQGRDRPGNPPGPDSDRRNSMMVPPNRPPGGPGKFGPPQGPGRGMGQRAMPQPPLGFNPGRRSGPGMVPPVVQMTDENPAGIRRRHGLRHAARQLEQLAADLEEAGVFDQADELRHRAGDFWRMAR